MTIHPQQGVPASDWCVSISSFYESVCVCVCVCVCMLSHSVTSNSFATPWTSVHQAPLSMGFSRQESWRGLPFPSPGDLPDPGVEPASLAPPVFHCATWEAPSFYTGDASKIPVVTTTTSPEIAQCSLRGQNGIGGEPLTQNLAL